MDIKFKEISRRKGTIDDIIPFKERELWDEHGLGLGEIWVVGVEVQMERKKIPIALLKDIAQEAIYQQKFEKVKEYTDEIKRRGYKVIIKDKF